MTMSNHVPLQSTNLSSVAYNPAAKELEVKFVNGTVYRYAGVAQHHFDRLTTAHSPGAYFHAHVRTAHAATKVHAPAVTR